MPLQRLLLKLKAHGIGNVMSNWIEKWLILFLIYINDLDDDITSKVLKFADDTTVFRKIKSDADRQQLQDDLNTLNEWSEKWQMLFNFGKCK